MAHRAPDYIFSRTNRTMAIDKFKIGDLVMCLYDSQNFHRGGVYEVVGWRDTHLLLSQDDRGSTTNGWHNGCFQKLEGHGKHLAELLYG